MIDQQNGTSLDYAWRQQRIWSETANSLKKRIEQGRIAALLLGIAAAGLAVFAVQMGTDSDVGRWVALGSGLAAAMVPFVQRRAGIEQIRVWTRARSVSEGLKTEIYTYLASGSEDQGDDVDQHLGDEARDVVVGVGDMLRYSAEISPGDTQAPDIHDIESYIAKRIDEQIGWYHGKAVHYEHRVRLLRGIANALAALAAALGVISGAFGNTSLIAWVPFLTTVGTSLIAYIAAARYDHMIVEYLRTEQRLEHLRDTRVGKQMSDSSFIDACESAISVENQAWMSRWNAPAKGE
jgi:hypothetical protein